MNRARSHCPSPVLQYVCVCDRGQQRAMNTRCKTKTNKKKMVNKLNSSSVLRPRLLRQITRAR